MISVGAHFIRLAICAGWTVLGVASASADPQTNDWIQPPIDTAKSSVKGTQERIDAVALLTERWKESLPELIKNIDSYYRAVDQGMPFADDDVPGLISITDIVMTIFLNKDGATQLVREVDTTKTVNMLAWATRLSQGQEQNRNLRFNAAYILASVVDNDKLCIVLDHLRDKTLGPLGMLNLLQVGIAGARDAYRENAQATKATAEILRPRVADAGSGKIAFLVEALASSADESPNRDVPLPEQASTCRDYPYPLSSLRAP